MIITSKDNEIIKNINFIRGNFDTSFIEKEMLKKED